MQRKLGSRHDAYASWLVGELLLCSLLGAALALYVAYPSLPHNFELPQLRMVLDTSIAIAGLIVAVLTAVRFAVDGRRTDLLLCSGFALGGLATLAFEIAPALDHGPVGVTEGWAALFGRLLAAGLICSAAFTDGPVRVPERALGTALAVGTLTLGIGWSIARTAFPAESADLQSPNLPIAYGLLALLYLVAMVGFGLRFRKGGQDLDSWLALAATLLVFASLNFVFTPTLPGNNATLADFLRQLAYGLLLVGVWRAIREAEFGRAVSEERGRVAREIHDGLAQYLFALSAHINMLKAGAPAETVLPRLEEAAALAQQEARFAVLALSSAGGRAPFDSALRRYVEFLTADGVLDVDVEIDPDVRLAPDEQIEVFRIVQEGLANVRKHASAHWAEIRIEELEGQRLVSVRDDGEGFVEEEIAPGQGLKNMRQRASSIGADLDVASKAGLGTTLKLALRG